MNRTTLLNTVTALLILLFVYTATSKLIDFNTFNGQLQHSPLLKDWANALAPIVIITELVIVGLLLNPLTRTGGLLGSLALLGSFTTYLSIALASGLKLPCSCGGIISAMSWQQHVIFNCAFIILTILALVFYPKPTKPSEFRQFMLG